jgi:VCBS repeat-containing protein
MRSMTFLVNDRSTGGRIPAVAVTITENEDGSLSFTLNVIGPYTGDLRGFFFDLADESLIGTLRVTPASPGFTEFRQGDDNIKDLGSGANMQGLLGSDGGYDAGIEIGTAGTGKDDYQSFSFTLTSSAGPLTLEDFSNVDFGLRLTSVGWGWGDRDGGVKLLEHTSSAIDAIDDANEIDEDQTSNSVGGNVFANDENLECAHFITAVNGSAWNVGYEVEGTYGTLRLKLDGSYTYTLKPAAQTLADGQTVIETFSYTAKSFDEFTSFSTDSAFLNITITGANDAPQIVAGTTSGQVLEDGSRTASGQLVAMDVDLGSQLVWSVTGSGPMTPRADYRFLLDNLNIVRDGLPFFNDDFGSGGPPPAAPAFNYFTFGTFTESGGRTIMDGGLGAPTTIPGAPTVIAHLATLNTDVGPDISQRLNRAQDFKVEARFDLVIPAEERSSYAVRLSDFGDDIVEVGVRRMEDGSVAVALREVDVAATIPLILEAIALEPAPGDQQIVLRLQHTANTNIVTASFDVLNGGVVTQTRSFTAMADIFSNEDWTRPQVIGQAIATPQNGVYGTLSVEADGEWHYSLNNSAANVQALAQGEKATDTFTVTVTDEHGAADTQTLTIDVVGTNDVPIITAGDVNGFVQEDGITMVTRQFTATDADDPHTLHWSVGPQSQVPLGGGSFLVFGYSSDYVFTLDALSITKNGLPFFSDNFDDGIPPPSTVPGFGYLVSGRVTESGGRAVFDGDFAAGLRGVATPDLQAGQLVTLITNTDPNDLTRGLKSDDDFVVEARFDLVFPDAGEAYGISLTDNIQGGLPADQLGDDLLSLLVRRDAEGKLIVRFSDADVVADSAEELQSQNFIPAADEDQIVLRLAHTASHRGEVHASFDLYDDGVFTRRVDFDPVGRIFGTDTPGYAGDDESWTRVQLVSFGFDTEVTSLQGKYGTLSVQQNGEWTYTLDNASAAVQALAQFQFDSDNFSVRVADEYGVSSFRPVFISVQGTNDPVVITSGPQGGTVVEGADTTPSPDDALSAFGTITFTDPDLADFHNAFAFFNPTPDNPSPLGSFNLGFVAEAPNAANGSIGWSYILDDIAAQHLAQGQTVFETYTVTVQDSWGSFATQEVTIAITGTDDGPGSNTPPVAVDDFVPEAISEDQHTLISVLANDFDVDFDPILVTMHNSFSVLGARITLGPAGMLDYDPTTSATLQNLNPGQFLNDSFTYVITDTKADSLPATVSVTVFGVEDGPNTPPDIAGGDMTGQVYEDGAASVARGQLTAVDPDSAVLNWTLDLTLPDSVPQFGFVNVDNAGQWAYFLNNSAVQHLGQGGSIQDDFVLRVTDDLGAWDTQTVVISITGTGDRPFFTTPAPVLSVGEDGPFVSGQTSASDVDNGTVLHWSLNRGSALGYFSDYEFRADSFSIEKNGAPLFHDEFDAGGPPPSAPDFIPPPPPGGSSAANYGTPTGMFQEIGGKLVMRGSEAFAFRGTGNNALVVGNEAILSTNNDPANLQGGLKQNHQFVVEGVFDLLEPGAARYGLTLTDGAGRVADDLLGLTVFRNPGDNKVYVQFANSNAVLDSALPVERHLLSPDGGVPDGVDQIRLKLTHEAGASHMSASYELLSAGSVVGDGELGQAGIFGSDTPGFAGDDENWIRAGLFSSGIDAGEFTQTLAGAYGTLTVDSEVPFTGQLVYTPGPAAQALRQGENVTDTFFVRVVDQQGMSTSQRIDVTVMGADDLPVAMPDANSVIEEVVITVMGNVLTNDFDLDHDTTLSIVDLDTLSVVDTAEYDGLYGTLTISANGSYVYMLDPVLAGPLGRGDIVFDTFEGVFGVTDGFFTSSAILEIRVIGTASEVVPPDPAPDVVGDGSDNVLVGTPAGERFYGGGGADLLVGLGGSDVFDYDSLSEGGDTIADFATGSGGDILDLEDLVQGDTSNPADFVQLQANGPNTTVLVDEDGTGSDYQPLATLQGVSGLSFEDFSAHNLLL